MMYQEFWCEHKPSVTISVKEDEWIPIGSWVFNNFEKISGISFLPYSEHSYQQAPYQECDKERYKEIASKTPSIVWEDL